MKSETENALGKKIFPHPVDRYVGERLRTLRVLRGYTQSKMGNALGLTFQQIQKYERGLNRVGSSRLYEISNILEVPISYFFEGADKVFGKNAVKKIRKKGGSLALHDSEGQKAYDFDNPMNRRETLDLVRSYYGIENLEVRRGVLALCKSLSTDSSKIDLQIEEKLQE